jgi:cell division septal protein FtsQ
MGRKNYEGPMLPGMEEEASPPPKPRVRSTPRRGSEISLVRVIPIVLLIAVALVAGLYGFHRFEHFLIRDPRFILNGPEGSPETSTLEISGATHVSRSQVEAVFADDSGRSVYLLPLSDRRETLRTVDWVKDASVARIWPNRVIVSIAERKPVAFVMLAASRFALIDPDGVMLPPAKDRFVLPVLRGVRASDPITERRERVGRMLRLTRELGDAAAKISEIDVSDRDNVKVTVPYEGRAETLLLGDHNFALRYQNFVRNYPEIKRRLPGAATLDLRIEDRITVVE